MKNFLEKIEKEAKSRYKNQNEINAFISGIKWFANLGETLTGYEIYGEDGICDYPVPTITVDPTMFNIGEEVVVQLRKKGEHLL